MGETHKLSGQAIGCASEFGIKSKRASHLHGRNSQAVGSGHRARFSTRHQEQVGESSAWEKLTGCWIRPLGSCQHLKPGVSGGAICVGETHKLSDQAIGYTSALGTKSKRGSYLHGRNSQAGEPSAWEKLTRCRIRPSGSRQNSAARANGGAIWIGQTGKRGSDMHGRNSPAVGSGHRGPVSTRHQEQAGAI